MSSGNFAPRAISSLPIAIFGKAFSVVWFGFLVLGAIDVLSGSVGVERWQSVLAAIAMAVVGCVIAATMWCSTSVLVIDHGDRLEIHSCRRHAFIKLSEIKEVAVAWRLGNASMVIRPRDGAALRKAVHFHPSKAPRSFTPPEQHPVLLDLRRRIAMSRAAPHLLVLVIGMASLFPAQAAEALVGAARDQTRIPTVYDGSYARIGYPMGDVAANRGVCTDVVIRAYRAIGIDLQVLIHEDMRANFSLYPRIWGLSKPDSNIDHRRVPNLQKFFERAGARISDIRTEAGFLPGDLVSWQLPGNLPHIGVVSDRKHPGSRRPLIIHNIGAGPVEDDILFNFPITGHYRYRVR